MVVLTALPAVIGGVYFASSTASHSSLVEQAVVAAQKSADEFAALIAAQSQLAARGKAEPVVETGTVQPVVTDAAVRTAAAVAELQVPAPTPSTDAAEARVAVAAPAPESAVPEPAKVAALVLAPQSDATEARLAVSAPAPEVVAPPIPVTIAAPAPAIVAAPAPLTAPAPIVVAAPGPAATQRPKEAPCTDEVAIAAKQTVIWFDVGKADVSFTQSALLKRLAAVLTTCPSARIEIRGHTDSVGLDNNNFALSWRRAETAREELVKEGFDPDRATLIGHGAREPMPEVRPAAVKEQNAINRRVEFRLR